MGQAERIQERPDIAAQASARYGSRGVPADWFLDPADPAAVGRYRESTRSTLEDQATAFLTAREGLAGLPDVGGPSSLRVLPGFAPEFSPSLPGVQEDPRPQSAPAVPPSWIGQSPAPGNGVDDDAELSWQADALCAQTDPEAFFPEKGGSTRDAKKVCGSCIVKSECLEYALENDERFGIWGGLSERERRRLRKRAV